MELNVCVFPLFFLSLGVPAVTSAGYFFVQWKRDNARLRDFGAELLANRKIDGATIERLMNKVYHNKGFTKNEGYYLFRKLGATPVQIMQGGGDCSDKSRLTAAVLGEYRIKSTLVMLAPCIGCQFGHTVVEARAEDGLTVVDPVYNLTFPSPNGGYYSLQELRDDPSILESRLDRLIYTLGKTDKIARYRRGADGAHYNHPKTINLDRNLITRSAKRIISWFVVEPELIYRPRFIEEPKLFCTVVASCLAGIFFGLALVQATLEARVLY